MDGRAWALILATLGLVLGVAARLRARRGGSASTLPRSTTLLVFFAIIIGTLPWVLGLGETVKNAGSITSIVVSIVAIVLLIIGRTRV